MEACSLETYQGISPLPDDFDAYWETALRELDRTKPRARFAPAGFRCPGVECRELYFQGTGGALIHAQYMRPAGKPRRAPAVLMFHGYGFTPETGLKSWGLCRRALRCSPWTAAGSMAKAATPPKGGQYAARTYHPRGGRRGPPKLLYRDVFLDTAQLARLAMTL